MAAADDDVLEDLRSLRKGDGATDARILDAGSLVRALGGRGEGPVVLRHRLVAAINSLDEPDDVNALLVAFGLREDVEGIKPLSARRARYGVQIERSADAIRDREDGALGALVGRLLTNYYAGAPVDQRLPMPHGGMLINRLVVLTTYDEGRFVEHRQERTIIPLVDGAAGFRYNTNNVRTRLTDLEGVTVTSVDTGPGTAHTFAFTAAVPKNRPYRFAFTERTLYESTDPPSSPDWAGQAFETPTLLYRQFVHFQGKRPQSIWSYQNLPLLERPGAPTAKSELELSDEGTTQHAFSEVYGGLYSGIAWVWT